MRRLLARYIIRRAWLLAKNQRLVESSEERRTRLYHTLNALSLVCTALGGHSGWMPVVVKNSFLVNMREAP